MVNYNNFAKTFSESRKNMKWEEIYYFFSKIWKFEWLNILDIWCWNWRLIWHIKDYFDWNFYYTWIDNSIEMINEAKIQYKEYDFFCQNMNNISLLKKYDLVFLIASFHHLNNIDKRIDVLLKIKNLIKKDSKIFMTNWALQSKLNFDKYKDCIIPNSKNQFWSFDYSIKIWEFHRYYHCFDLKELQYLAEKTWFKIIENRLFDNQKNFITILEKIN